MVENSVTPRMEVKVTSPSSPSSNSPGDPPSIYLTLPHTNLLHTSPERTWAFRMGHSYADTKDRHTQTHGRIDSSWSPLCLQWCYNSPPLQLLNNRQLQMQPSVFFDLHAVKHGQHNGPLHKTINVGLLRRNMSFIVRLSVTSRQEMELI